MTYTLMVAGNYTLIVRLQPGGQGPYYALSSSNINVACSISNAYP